MVVVKVKELNRFVDDRGILDQVYNKDLPFKPKRVYVIHGRKDAIRGLHGHKKEWKAFYVAKGMVYFVTVTMKEHFGKSVTLSEKKPELLIVPPSYFNGMKPLEDSIIFCFSSLTLEESMKDDIRMPPFSIGKKIWEQEGR